MAQLSALTPIRDHRLVVSSPRLRVGHGERGGYLAGAEVPEVDVPVAVRSDQRPAIRGIREVSHAQGVGVSERRGQLARGGVI